MASIIKIKAYLNKNEEIRLFKFQKETLSYENIFRYCSHLFELNVDNVSIKITWKDNDGDEITISSDEELLDAVISQKKTPIAIFITTENKVTGVIHPDIVCNQCQHLVEGLRFVCLECDNFDLCQKCHKEGYHSQHSLLVQSYPGQLNRSMTRKMSQLNNSTWNRVSKRRHPATQVKSTGIRPVELDSTNESTNSAVTDTISLSSDVINETISERLSRFGISCEPRSHSNSLQHMDSISSTKTTMDSISNADSFVVIDQQCVKTTASREILPPNIKSSKEKMESMGFVDKDGWLTKLLLRYNGDIDKCLDVIHKQTNKKF